MVFQHFNLFPNMTVRRNITLAPVQTKLMSQAEADAEADKLLARVGLADRGDSYPSALSGGQKREVGDRVLFMADGKIAESGTPKDIFEHPQCARLQDFLAKVL